MDQWASRPKERHHIFPQAFARHFKDKGIEIHKYVVVIDADVHARIHRGAAGGPWNADWFRFIQDRGELAKEPAYMEQASAMIQKYGLFGLTVTYWQQVNLPPRPVEE